MDLGLWRLDLNVKCSKKVFELSEWSRSCRISGLIYKQQLLLRDHARALLLVGEVCWGTNKSWNPFAWNPRVSQVELGKARGPLGQSCGSTKLWDGIIAALCIPHQLQA